MKKFGGWLDEDENVVVGGTTICECFTYCIKCQANPNRELRKQKQKEASQEDVDGEFAAEEQDGEGAHRGGGDIPDQKKRGCCAVCCRAIFCCGSGNTVSRQIELADLRRNLDETGPLLDASADRTMNDEGTHIDPAGSSEGHDNDLLSNEKQGGGNTAINENSGEEKTESEIESSIEEEDQ